MQYFSTLETGVSVSGERKRKGERSAFLCADCRDWTSQTERLKIPVFLSLSYFKHNRKFLPCLIVIYCKTSGEAIK